MAPPERMARLSEEKRKALYFTFNFERFLEVELKTGAESLFLTSFDVVMREMISNCFAATGDVAKIDVMEANSNQECLNEGFW